MKIKKAVIPVAGYGTRLLPVTKTIPKTMIPVVDKPVIQYVVEQAVQSGIEEIIFVTSANNKPLEDYFDIAPELEAQLERSGKLAQLRQIQAVVNMSETVYVRQKGMHGNGHAVLMARPAVGDEPFLMLWGDDILLHDPPVPRQLMDVAERLNGPVVGVRRVPPEDFEKYGMLEVEAIRGEPDESRVRRAISVVEKPKREESPSDLAQIGGFVLTPDIFDLLASSETDDTGEIYLAAALEKLMRQREVYAYDFEGTRYDCGNKLDLLRATVELALQRDDLGQEFADYLAGLDIAAFRR